LSPASARELGHQGDEDEPPAFRACHEGSQAVRRMADVGIGQEQVVRRLTGDGRMLNAVLLGPYLARPSCRQSRSAQDLETWSSHRQRRGSRAIVAAVIHQHDAEGTWIVLSRQ